MKPNIILFAQSLGFVGSVILAAQGSVLAGAFFGCISMASGFVTITHFRDDLGLFTRPTWDLTGLSMVFGIGAILCAVALALT